MPPQPLFPGGMQPPQGARGPPPQLGPMDGPPKPAFPAYQNMESPATTSSPDKPARQASKVPPVGAGCKLVHPEDDLSMVSVIIVSHASLVIWGRSSVCLCIHV